MKIRRSENSKNFEQRLPEENALCLQTCFPSFIVLPPTACMFSKVTKLKRPLRDKKNDERINKKAVCGNNSYGSDLSIVTLNLNRHSASSVRNFTRSRQNQSAVCTRFISHITQNTSASVSNNSQWRLFVEIKGVHFENHKEQINST